jgi:hypothetical protein
MPNLAYTWSASDVEFRSIIKYILFAFTEPLMLLTANTVSRAPTWPCGGSAHVIPLINTPPHPLHQTPPQEIPPCGTSGQAFVGLRGLQHCASNAASTKQQRLRPAALTVCSSQQAAHSKVQRISPDSQGSISYQTQQCSGNCAAWSGADCRQPN